MGPTIQDQIEAIIKKLKGNDSSDQDGRAKSLTITKLEEAAMWADRIYQ